MAFTDVEQIPLSQQIALSTASAKNQMAFQERMSNTAHQREVADLKAAGLNPILSTHSQGASTPSGAEGDYGFDQQLLNVLSQSVTTNAQAVNGILGKGLGRNSSNGSSTVPNDWKDIFGLGNVDSDGNWIAPDWMIQFLKGQKIYIKGLGYITNLDKLIPPLLSAGVNAAVDLSESGIDWVKSEEGTQGFNDAVKFYLDKARGKLNTAAKDLLSLFETSDDYKGRKKGREYTEYVSNDIKPIRQGYKIETRNGRKVLVAPKTTVESRRAITAKNAISHAGRVKAFGA